MIYLILYLIFATAIGVARFDYNFRINDRYYRNYTNETILSMSVLYGLFWPIGLLYSIFFYLFKNLD